MGEPTGNIGGTQRVTVFRDKFSRSWPRHERGTRAFVLELGDVLTRVYDTDAHFAAYVSPNERRLGREAVDAGVHPTLGVCVFDVDCPATHGTSDPAPDWWRWQLRERLRALAAAHPGPLYYETRGGARIVYRRSSFVVESAERARRWSQEYAVAVAYLERRFGIQADPACGDWQRLFRCPRATRDRAEHPENWVMIGDPHDVGELFIEPTQEDLERAVERCNAFYVTQRTDYVPTEHTAGLFFRMLYLRGDVLDEREPGVFVIRCPNESEHTSGRTGDSSTLLYPPAAGFNLGVIHCKHAHCSGKTAHDWLRLFSEREHEAATNLLLDKRETQG